MKIAEKKTLDKCLNFPDTCNVMRTLETTEREAPMLSHQEKVERAKMIAQRMGMAAENAGPCPEEMLGMTIAKNPESFSVPYTFTGPRGGVKRLVRSVGNPRLMHVIDKYGQISSIKGNYTFADEAPKGLRPVDACNLYR